MATPLPLDRRLETVAQLIVRARVFFDLWWFYESADTRSIIKGTWENYDQFCIFDRHANLIAFTVQIAAVFDRSKRTISLPQLIRELESSGSDNALAEAKANLTRAKAMSAKVEVLRHNLFGHRSASLSYTEAFKQAGVTPNELRELTEVALQIANGLLAARGLNWTMFNESPGRDVERMFRRLGQPTKTDDP